jgi:hypothetical protein
LGERNDGRGFFSEDIKECKKSRYPDHQTLLRKNTAKCFPGWRSRVILSFFCDAWTEEFVFRFNRRQTHGRVSNAAEPTGEAF